MDAPELRGLFDLFLLISGCAWVYERVRKNRAQDKARQDAWAARVDELERYEQMVLNERYPMTYRVVLSVRMDDPEAPPLFERILDNWEDADEAIDHAINVCSAEWARTGIQPMPVDEQEREDEVEAEARNMFLKPIVKDPATSMARELKGEKKT